MLPHWLNKEHFSSRPEFLSNWERSDRRKAKHLSGYLQRLCAECVRANRLAKRPSVLERLRMCSAGRGQLFAHGTEQQRTSGEVQKKKSRSRTGPCSAYSSQVYQSDLSLYLLWCGVKTQRGSREASGAPSAWKKPLEVETKHCRLTTPTSLREKECERVGQGWWYL